MWKAQASAAQAPPAAQDDDDWDTDPDFVNNVSEKQQRFTSLTIPAAEHPSGRDSEKIDLAQLTEAVTESHERSKRAEWGLKNSFSKGYGGRFGLQNEDQAPEFRDAPGSRSNRSSLAPGDGLSASQRRAAEAAAISNRTAARDAIVEAVKLSEPVVVAPVVATAGPTPPPLAPKPTRNLLAVSSACDPQL